MPDSTTTITGSMGRDPDLRFTTGGRAVCSFSVAVSHRYRSGDEWKETTSWFDVTAWAELGEHIAASCTSGTRVVVTGRMERQEWNDKETGDKRSKMVLIADDVGVSLKWATAQVERIERTGGRDD